MANKIALELLSAVSRMSGLLQLGLFFAVHRNPKNELDHLLVSRNETSNSKVVSKDK
jgi:hypothetical protein